MKLDLLEENKLLRSLQENCEQKQQDILEENILLREEISHLTERLRKAHLHEVSPKLEYDIQNAYLSFCDRWSQGSSCNLFTPYSKFLL